MSLSYERLADSSNEDEEEVNVMHLRNVLSHRRFDKDGGNDGEVTFTVEDAVEHIGFGKFQIFLTLIMGTFSFSDACEMMLLAVLSPVLRCHWQLSSFQVACITTVVFVGMLIGSPVFGTASDRFGRRPILILVAVWICYYGYMTALSPTFFWLLFLRFLVGFGIGGAPQGFTALSEFLPSKQRAKLLGSFQVFWALGTCFEVFMAYLIIPSLGWRYLVGISAVPLTISLLSFLNTSFASMNESMVEHYVPESVRYNIAAGKQEKALETLEKIARTNGIQMPPGELVKSKEVPRGKIQDLFTSDYLRTTLQLWYLWFSAAFGYYGLVLISSEILEFDSVCGAMEKWNQDSLSEDVCYCQLLTKSDYLTLIFTTLGELLAIPINMILPDVIGRTRLLCLYFVVSAIGNGLILVCSTRLVLTITVFAVRACTSGIFNIVYLYTVEVYPTTVRALGLGSGSAIARVGAMITPFVAQVLLTYSIRSAMILYAGVCLLASILSITLPIETKGRSIQEFERQSFTSESKKLQICIYPYMGERGVSAMFTYGHTIHCIG
ncbi:putative transporter SVOPL [Ptychodera flava]|uniref:putative transporter SVOPL n=1 Tax=Ptychodera flava TaxID=63121 RepID=UPI003969CE6A